MGRPLRFKDFTNVEHRPGEDELVSYRAQKRKRSDTEEGADYTSKIFKKRGGVKRMSSSKYSGNNPAAQKMYQNRAVANESSEDTMVCKDCGCEQDNITPSCDCPHDSTNKDGNWWVPKTNEALDLVARMKRSRLMKRIRNKLKMGRKRAMRKMASRSTMLNRTRKAARKEIAKLLTRGIPKSDLNVARKKEIEKRLDSSAMQTRITRFAKKMLPKKMRAERERKKNT